MLDEKQISEMFGITLEVAEDNTSITIKWIEVPEENRFKGIGTKVISYIKEYALKHNKSVRLFSSPRNFTVMEFYLKLGFEQLNNPFRFQFNVPD